MTGAVKGTVTRLLESVGTACAEYQDKTLRNLSCKTIGRPHKTLNLKRNLGITPTMADGVADYEWTIEEIVNLLS